MSSIRHSQLHPFRSRARRALATAVVGVGLTSAGCVAASAATQAPRAEDGAAPASSAVYQRGMRETRAYEAKGYVPTACTVHGTLLVDPHTRRSVTIEP